MELKESGEGENLGIVPDKTQGVPEGPEGRKGKNREKGEKLSKEAPGGSQRVRRV